jgi:hypothetical protein
MPINFEITAKYKSKKIFLGLESATNKFGLGPKGTQIMAKCTGNKAQERNFVVKRTVNARPTNFESANKEQIFKWPERRD